MHKKILAGISMGLIALGAVTHASAQEKTRAEVRQELIEAQKNGSRFVTDTSYPDVAPIFAQQVARMKQQNDSGVGADMSSAGQTGNRVNARASASAASTSNTCEGPVSFCTPHFGG
jgi:Domain of unknown function (DUF4148)